VSRCPGCSDENVDAPDNVALGIRSRAIAGVRRVETVSSGGGACVAPQFRNRRVGRSRCAAAATRLLVAMEKLAGGADASGSRCP